MLGFSCCDLKKSDRKFIANVCCIVQQRLVRETDWVEEEEKGHERIATIPRSIFSKSKSIKTNSWQSSRHLFRFSLFNSFLVGDVITIGYMHYPTWHKYALMKSCAKTNGEVYEKLFKQNCITHRRRNMNDSCFKLVGLVSSGGIAKLRNIKFIITRVKAIIITRKFLIWLWLC